MAIYFSIDSVLDPNYNIFSFLEGKRIKTKKILNTLSQGLLGDISWLTDVDPSFDTSSLTIDFDVTKHLKVKKYVMSCEINEYTSNNYNNLRMPEFIQKTDEERIQNAPKMLQKMAGREVVITRKEDGTSTTYIYYNKFFMICGRNYRFSEKDKSNKHYFEIEEMFSIKDKLEKLNMNIAVQGEIVGPKINGNKLKLMAIDYRIFNIWDIDSQSYLSHDKVIAITDELGLNRVPEIYRGTFKTDWNVSSLLVMAESLEYGPKCPAEGMVVKTNDNSNLPRYSFKVISNKYLLK